MLSLYDEKFYWKKKWTNKGTDNTGWFFVTQQSLSYPTFVPNLIILSQVVAEKSLTEDLHIHYIGVRDGKIEHLKKKEK